LSNHEGTFVPLPETMQELTVGMLGVKVPPEWGVSLTQAQWSYMRDMRLAEIERRILALEAQGIETGTAETERLSPKGESPVGNADAPTPSNPTGEDVDG